MIFTEADPTTSTAIILRRDPAGEEAAPAINTTILIPITDPRDRRIPPPIHRRRRRLDPPWKAITTVICYW